MTEPFNVPEARTLADEYLKLDREFADASGNGEARLRLVLAMWHKGYDVAKMLVRACDTIDALGEMLPAWTRQSGKGAE